jgi:hypothetical protein
MVVNYRARRISRDTRKLVRTSILIIKKINFILQVYGSLSISTQIFSLCQYFNHKAFSSISVNKTKLEINFYEVNFNPLRI